MPIGALNINSSRITPRFLFDRAGGETLAASSSLQWNVMVELSG